MFVNKRGQFYLIASLIIISAILSLIVLTNKSTIFQNPNIEYLKDEITIESSNIIDYGIYAQATGSLGEIQIQGMLINLSEYYINNTQDSNLYFMVGNKTNMTLIAYQRYPEPVEFSFPPGGAISFGTSRYYKHSFTSSSSVNSINIKINGTTYNFNLNTGENIHFVIKSVNEGQIYKVKEYVYTK